MTVGQKRKTIKVGVAVMNLCAALCFLFAFYTVKTFSDGVFLAIVIVWGVAATFSVVLEIKHPAE